MFSFFNIVFFIPISSPHPTVLHFFQKITATHVRIPIKRKMRALRKIFKFLKNTGKALKRRSVLAATNGKVMHRWQLVVFTQNPQITLCPFSNVRPLVFCTLTHPIPRLTRYAVFELRFNYFCMQNFMFHCQSPSIHICTHLTGGQLSSTNFFVPIRNATRIGKEGFSPRAYTFIYTHICIYTHIHIYIYILYVICT